MKTNRKVICSSSAVRYAETLFELNIPKETIEKTREIFSEVPQITDVTRRFQVKNKKKAWNRFCAENTEQNARILR